MAWIAFGAGMALLLVLVADVHATVFIPRGRAGVISKRFYRASWRLWKALGARLPASRRRQFLSWLGPVMVPLTVIVWGALLITSFALLYAPWVGTFSVSPEESGPVPNWARALYYSGYSAVTLGVGDVTPNGTAPRLMAVVEAGLGFALFTVSVTYLLSVYSARNQATALAVAVSRFIGRSDGQSPAELLASVTRARTEAGLGEWLGAIAFNLATLAELRGQYPLLHYFHEPRDDRAIPIALSDLLELTTLSLALLDPERYRTLAEGPSILAVDRLARHYLEDFDTDDPRAVEAMRRSRRTRYDAARAALAEAGVALRADTEAWSRFERLSARWDVADECMRDLLGYRHVDEEPEPGAPA